MSARSFSRQLGVADNNTQNYISNSKPSIPNADYLERVLHQFKSISSLWLLTGEGDPFLSDSSPTQPHENHADHTTSKNFTQNLNSGVSTGQVGNSTDKGPPPSSEQQATLEREIAFLQAQLRMKDELLAAKEETITLLKAAYGRPN